MRLRNFPNTQSILSRATPALVCAASLVFLVCAGSGRAEGAADADEINARLYEQLAPPKGSGRIETVSGQMYLSKENIDANVIGEALAAMLDPQQVPSQAVAVQRAPRINFEIHFPKNSAVLTDESRASLDELARALRDENYGDLRFVLGGHTDQDGDETVNQPLSEARAQAARGYLVEQHAIDAERLVARGFGASDPLREVEQSPQDKLYNRRVDLRPLH